MTDELPDQKQPDPKEAALGFYLAARRMEGANHLSAMAEAIKMLASLFPEMTPKQGSAIMNEVLREHQNLQR